MSEFGRYCCKSPKLPGDNFPAIRRSDRRPPIRVISIALPKSPVSLARDDEVPRVLIRKSRLKPGEFLITSAKRLLQHNLPTAEVSNLEAVDDDCIRVAARLSAQHDHVPHKSQGNHRRMTIVSSSARRPDILVYTEQVGRIEVPFDHGQSLVIVAIGRFDAFLPLVHEKIHICPACGMRVERVPI